MRLDLHVHMKRSYRLSDIRTAIKRAGLGGIAVTNFWDISFAQWLQSKLGGEFLMIVGKEVVSTEGHILAIGLEKDVPDHLPPRETIDLIHEQSALAILPHPFLLSNAIAPIGKNANLTFDAIEIFNYRGGPFLWPNALAWLFLRNRKIAMVANSDSKKLSTIGASCIDAPGKTLAEILQNIKAGNFARYTKMEWPSLAWLAETAPYFVKRYNLGQCSVCHEKLQFKFFKRDIRCDRCGRVLALHAKCAKDHSICNECGTKRDYAPEALFAYREALGLEV